MTTAERLRAAMVSTAANNGHGTAELGEYGCFVDGQWIKTADSDFGLQAGLFSNDWSVIQTAASFRLWELQPASAGEGGGRENYTIVKSESCDVTMR